MKLLYGRHDQARAERNRDDTDQMILQKDCKDPNMSRNRIVNLTNSVAPQMITANSVAFSQDARIATHTNQFRLYQAGRLEAVDTLEAREANTSN